MNFFDDKQEELYKELESWLGTPFKHKQGIKGVGTDCIQFVAKVLEHFGFGPFKFPDYAKDWHMHKTSGLLMTNLMKQVKGSYEVPLWNIKSGDIVLYHIGNDSAHGGIYFVDEWGDRYLYHSINPFGVVKLDFDSAVKLKKEYQIASHIVRVS